LSPKNDFTVLISLVDNQNDYHISGNLNYPLPFTHFKDQLWSVSMSSQKRIELNEEHKNGSQAASVSQSERGLLQYYFDLPPSERTTQFAEVSRAAIITGISSRTIQRWAKQHRIRAIFVAEKYQIEIDSLISYIEQRAWARDI
jgi:excisionase family DNA binding protein